MRNFDSSFDRMFDGLGWNDLFEAGFTAGLPFARMAGGDAALARAESQSVTAGQSVLPPAADIPATTATTTTIASGGLLVSTLENNGDHDWIKITLTAGQHVTLLLSGFGPGGLEDPLVNLRASTGAVLATNDDIENGVIRDSRLEFTATTAGTYYIDAGAYSNGYAGDYVLQVFDSQSTIDSIAATTATTARMEYGGDYNGVLEAGNDHDWIAVTLQAGQEYVVRASGDGTSPLSNPLLAVRAANGAVIGQNDNTYGLNPEVSFTASVTGTYFIDVGSSGNASSGEYSVSITPALEPFTFDQIATQLTETYWGDGQHAFIIGADRALTYDISALPANVQTIAKAALQTWADVLGITFVAQVGGAEITFGDTQDGAFANSTYNASGAIRTSTVNISTAWVADYGTSLDSYTMQTYIHEIGHALGLGHAGDYNGSATYPLDASFENDAWSTTVMSYFSPGENDYFAALGFTTHYLATPMNGDVVAMIDLYGASTVTRTGNTTYGFGSTVAPGIFNASNYPDVAYCIVDSGGIDTLDYSLFAQNQLINLATEQFMNIGAGVGNVMIGRGTVIENARGGSGVDTVLGNAAANSLFGNAGGDTLASYDGNDMILGGTGDDRVWGGGGDDKLYGEVGADRIDGNHGNDLVSGGAGNDVIAGSWGDDILYGDLDNDVLFGGSGVDKLVGGDGNDRLLGGDQNDWLEGGAGNDVMYGGKGIDVLFGGAGSDRMILDSVPNASNRSDLRDFEHLVDKIVLDRAAFTAIGPDGGLAPAAFRAGVAALEADDRIIYNAATGQIFYDADGLGGAAQVCIAKVNPGTAITSGDFAVFSSAPAAAPVKVAAAEAYDPAPAYSRVADVSSIDLFGL